MALKSTIYKADCQIAGMDRGYYQKQIQPKLEHFSNLTVINLPKPATDQLAQLVKTLHAITNQPTGRTDLDQ